MPLTMKPKQEIKIPEEIKVANPSKSNRYLTETFEELKARVFEQNYRRLNYLFEKEKERFIDYEIDKKNGRFVELRKGGSTLIMTLFNHEVYYHVETEMTSWLNRFIKDKLNEPVEHLSCDD